MKLPEILNRLPTTKFSVTALSVGLVSGALLTAVSVANHDNSRVELTRNAAATTSQQAAAATDEPTEADSTAPATDGPTGGTSGATGQTGGSTGGAVSGNTTGGVVQNPSAPAANEQPAPSPIVPVTTVSSDVSYVLTDGNPNMFDAICTYQMSDGTTRSKFGGRVPANVQGRVSYGIMCPDTY